MARSSQVLQLPLTLLLLLASPVAPAGATPVLDPFSLEGEDEALLSAAVSRCDSAFGVEPQDASNNPAPGSVRLGSVLHLEKSLSNEPPKWFRWTNRLSFLEATSETETEFVLCVQKRDVSAGYYTSPYTGTRSEPAYALEIEARLVQWSDGKVSARTHLRMDPPGTKYQGVQTGFGDYNLLLRSWLETAVRDDSLFELGRTNYGKILPNRVLFSPDGKLLAAGGGEIKVWNLSTRQLLWAAGEPGDALVFSPDGATLASRSNGEVTLWQSALGKKLHTLGKYQPSDMTFSPDGKLLALVDAYGVTVLDVSTGEQIATLDCKRAYYGTQSSQLAFAPKGGRLLARCSLDSVKLWEVTTGNHVDTIRFPKSLNSLALSPDGSTLLLAGTEPAQFLEWDLSKNQAVGELHLQSGYHVNCLALAPDGRTVAACVDYEVVLWDRITLTEISRLKGHDNTVKSVAFSPDGQMLASAASDGFIKLWMIPRKPPGDASREPKPK